MKCVNCEREEAVYAWDSLAFRREQSWDTVMECATGYEKVGLCPSCRRSMAKKFWPMLLPKQHRILCYTADILGAVGAVLAMLDFFLGSKTLVFVGFALLAGCLTKGYVQRNGDNLDSTAIGFGLLLGIAGALTAFATVLSPGRSQISAVGCLGTDLYHHLW